MNDSILPICLLLIYSVCEDVHVDIVSARGMIGDLVRVLLWLGLLLAATSSFRIHFVKYILTSN